VEEGGRTESNEKSEKGDTWLESRYIVMYLRFLCTAMACGVSLEWWGRIRRVTCTLSEEEEEATMVSVSGEEEMARVVFVVDTSV
jgi:uncharacterized protein (UPF0218 family)